MEENHHSQRNVGARSIHAAIDVAKVREQLANVLPRLRRYARALARSPLEADDLVHATVVRALARAEQLRAQPRPLPWLLSLMSRAWADETPARSRQARAFNIEQAADGVSEARRELLTVQEALSRLQEEQHRAVALVLVEGFSYREAAEMESVAPPTLAARLLRGRLALLRLLDVTLDPGTVRALADDTLTAYVDGEMDPAARTRIEEAMAADEILARRIEALRAQSERLRRAFDRALEEPVPERLLAVARSAPALQRRNNVIPLRRRARPARLTWAQAGTLAAALAAGIVLGELLPPRWSSPFRHGAHGGVLADRTLSAALNSQLTGVPARGVLIGGSFHPHAGGYCRTFALHEGPVMTGLACRGADGWRVRSLTEGEPRPQAAAGAAAVPVGLSRSLQEELGAPLDPQAEIAARARGWK